MFDAPGEAVLNIATTTTMILIMGFKFEALGYLEGLLKLITSHKN